MEDTGELDKVDNPGSSYCIGPSRTSSNETANMKLVSVNCGLPCEVAWRGMRVTTSIYKEPVEGPVVLRTLNLDGDRQSDLTVHGGKDKAVYCYPLEHYEYWKTELPHQPLPIGVFGENFTIEGGTEDTVFIGDRFSIGSAEVVVSQPRLPCYKLDIRFNMKDMTRRFLLSRRTGFYVAVTVEGEVSAQDDVTLVSHDPDPVSVSEITRLFVAKEFDSHDVQQVRKALLLKALPEDWKEIFVEKLSRLSM
jgi:MOSC domain-containing protein YiiM